MGMSAYIAELEAKGWMILEIISSDADSWCLRVLTPWGCEQIVRKLGEDGGYEYSETFPPVGGVHLRYDA